MIYSKSQIPEHLHGYFRPAEYGLEASPAEYAETMRVVFSEARRVLADDGTLWLNIGDSYQSSGGMEGVGPNAAVGSTKRQEFGRTRPRSGLPAKNLLGIPWRVAFALQEDGWILRNDIIWHKPNAMPESVTDRLSTRHEHMFMFAKAKWTGDSVLDLDDADAAWLAALIDGEGTITIARDKRSEKDPAHQDVFQVCVSIANSSVPLLEKAGRLMGGAHPRKNNEGVNRPVYAVQVSGKKAAEVIAAVKPWLIDKLPQADIALALQDTQRAAGVDKASYQTAEGRAYKERLWEAVRAANRREDQDLSWIRPAKRGRWSPQPYWFDLDPIRVPHEHPDIAHVDRSRPQRGFIGQADVARAGPHEAGRNPGDMWSIATQPFPGAHFAAMPPKLAERCILAGCKPGGTVLDPFSGSGTTGMVAGRLGRKYVGIDLSREYLDLSLRTRLAQSALLDFGEATA